MLSKPKAYPISLLSRQLTILFITNRIALTIFYEKRMPIANTWQGHTIKELLIYYGNYYTSLFITRQPCGATNEQP